MHLLSQDVAILPRVMGHHTTMVQFPCHASMPQFQSHLHHSIIAQHGCHGIVMWFWHCSIMAQLWHCAIVLQHPSYGHVSSTRFHCAWAHTYCLPDLVILVSTLQTHSSIVSPWCTPSPWPNASGAKKLQWVQRYVQKSCMNMFLFMVHSLPPFICLSWPAK